MMVASKGIRSSAVEHTYAGTTHTLNQARVDIADWLMSHDLGHLTDTAQLVLSELTSNAVEASPGTDYRVATSISADHIIISVTNLSTGALPEESDWLPENPLAPQGRGLSIIDALSESVEIETTATNVTVSAYLRITAN